MKILALAALSLPTLAVADEVNLFVPPQNTVETYLIAQLKCSNRPDTTKVFLGLALNKLINLQRSDGYDSVACYDLAAGFALDGLPVHRICGVIADSLDWQMFPQMYRRDPGTRPPELLEIHTTATYADLIAFAARHRLETRIDQSSDGNWVATCWQSTWMSHQSFPDKPE